MTDLAALDADLVARIAAAPDLAALDAVRVEALGKQGSVSSLLKGMGALSPDERREQGPRVNALRDRISAALAVRRAALEGLALDAALAAKALDLSLPAPFTRTGSVHPTLQVKEEMVAIFADLGFSVAEGPDIEDDWHNFTALNFPPKHPARETHDTFFLAPDAAGERKVLRTHTSPVQIRTMMAGAPPYRIVAPGRTYRKDSDATHTPMFHQLEGLVIDREITMGHLKWTLTEFVRRFFETDEITARFRPHHFPFTEPSAEMDIGCDRSGGEIRVGKGGDWLEVVGCGMVHPKVLRACGVDPDEWQGFAFGFGIDRLAMLKYGMADLRDMFAADTRWLAHYGFSPFQAPSPSAGLS